MQLAVMTQPPAAPHAPGAVRQLSDTFQALADTVRSVQDDVATMEPVQLERALGGWELDHVREGIDAAFGGGSEPVLRAFDSGVAAALQEAHALISSEAPGPIARSAAALALGQAVASAEAGASDLFQISGAIDTSSHGFQSALSGARDVKEAMALRVDALRHAAGVADTLVQPDAPSTWADLASAHQANLRAQLLGTGNGLRHDLITRLREAEAGGHAESAAGYASLLPNLDAALVPLPEA